MGRSTSAIAGLSLLLAACGDSPTGVPGPADLSAEWRTDSPSAQGLDPDRVAAAVAHARTLPQVQSLLVVRNGRLVVEEYFNGGRSDRLNDVRSVTKSVVSTLVGIAVAEGLLPSIDTPIGTYLGAEYADVLDEAEAAITFRDLLTMSSGFEWDESTSVAYNQWVTSDDPVRYVLSLPLTNPPGTKFTYNSPGVHLLSIALERATGLSTQQLASRYLFNALGVRAVAWETFRDGRANGGSGIDLRARDLAKLGALWLRDGDPGSGPIVPPGWVSAATTSRFPLWQGGGPLAQQGYGYLWWIDHTGSRTHFFAWGYGGQFVWVAPELEMVVVVTTDWRAATVSVGQLATNGIRLIVDHVLPAAR